MSEPDLSDIPESDEAWFKRATWKVFKAMTKKKDKDVTLPVADRVPEGRADNTDPPLGGGEPEPPLAQTDEDYTIEVDPEVTEPEPAPDQPVAEVVPEGGADPYPPVDASPENPVEVSAPIWEGGSSGSATPPEVKPEVFDDPDDDEPSDFGEGDELPDEE